MISRFRAKNLLGVEGQGFKVILDGMNAERILIAAECVGDGRYFIDKASRYATDRVVFDRPIGQNQGVQFPIARCYTEVEAAWLMVEKAAHLFDAGEACGAEANMAKMLASEASWRAGDVLHANPRRLCVRKGISYRTQVSGNPSLPNRADLKPI